LRCIFGFSRILAKRELGERIKVKVYEASDKDEELWGLIENVHHRGLPWAVLAKRAVEMVELGNWDWDEFADALGKSKDYLQAIASVYRRLDEDLKEMACSGKLGYSLARQICRLPPGQQSKLAEEAKRGEWPAWKLRGRVRAILEGEERARAKEYVVPLSEIPSPDEFAVITPSGRFFKVKAGERVPDRVSTMAYHKEGKSVKLEEFLGVLGSSVEPIGGDRFSVRCPHCKAALIVEHAGGVGPPKHRVVEVG